MSHSKWLAALQAVHAGQWDQAHEIVQRSDDPIARWIHAYLHRLEGDTGNAAYWYRQAGREFPKIPSKDEWQAIHENLTEGANIRFSRGDS
jgi:hypothetical protein